MVENKLRGGDKDRSARRFMKRAYRGEWIAGERLGGARERMVEKGIKGKAWYILSLTQIM